MFCRCQQNFQKTKYTLKPYKFFQILIILLSAILLITGCFGSSMKINENDSDFVTTAGRGEALTIVAGSEHKVLEPILENYAKQSKKKIEVTYLGSLDIMRQLQSGEVEYDAVWPASTLWLTMGDEHHLLKHVETTAITPVIFGIKQSLAEELGFTDRSDIVLEEIIQAIENDQLNFAMTSATQSNSGASAYLGFLTALSKNPEAGFTKEDLADPLLQEKILSLLSGVNRSSGSSNWLVDLFLMGDYNAMVNYETLIIQTNEQLEAQGKETLYAVYPVDGLSISDSPLGYVNKGDAKKEEAFLEFQEYILSDEAQSEIEKTGKRNSYGKVRDENKIYYKPEWGIQVDKVLSPLRFPPTEVIEEALTLYQTSFKKPAYTVYILDYSSSMRGDRQEQMVDALAQVLLPENAKQHLLLGTQQDQTIIIPFSSEPMDAQEKSGNDLTELYDFVESTFAGGNTAMYEATLAGLEIIKNEPDLAKYNPAIVLLTDGEANGDLDYFDLEASYLNLKIDVPIFSIKFGDSADDQLDMIASLTNARVFDGRENLIEAFRSVKGYN